MSGIAISVEHVSKQYRIGAWKSRHDTLGSLLAARAGALLRRGSRSVAAAGGDASPRAERDRMSAEDSIWSLKDVSFDVPHGEALGIVGHNGAGKSTLLRILSRITMPTSGRAVLYARVGSLLEIGTGFHPELTGRENMYLSGAVLGMKRREIAAKFDAIVDFAEVERFLDTPVKRYSTGMYLRLAFAVAVHLEPEILIVDEVLGVGDARFQKKCLTRIQDVLREGRTVLLVSHSLPTVTQLCKRALLFDQGRLVADGPAAQVIEAYVSPMRRTTAEREWGQADTPPGGDVARLRAVRLRSEEDEIAETVDIRRPFTIEMEYDVLTGGAVLLPYVNLHDGAGVFLFSAHDLDPDWEGLPRPAGRWLSVVQIPGNLLAEGTHAVTAGLVTLDPVINQFDERDVLSFRVVEHSPDGTARGGWVGPMDGVVRPALQWRTTLLRA
jgi:lipopolysaccharide transport system ATP-binding protein